MIAPAKAFRSRRSSLAWHRDFLRMMPKILEIARWAFRKLDAERRQEAIAETLASAFEMYHRLVELGREHLAYPSPLALYAIRHCRAGRRVGSRLNIGDVLSPYAQHRKGIVVESLDRFDEEENQWREAVVEDTRSSPVPDVVAFRCDFSDWLHDLPRRNRRLAESLAVGHTTGEVARKFGVSPGRVSQLRRELEKSWERLQGEHTTPAPVKGNADWRLPGGRSRWVKKPCAGFAPKSFRSNAFPS